MPKFMDKYSHLFGFSLGYILPAVLSTYLVKEVEKRLVNSGFTHSWGCKCFAKLTKPAFVCCITHFCLLSLEQAREAVDLLNDMKAVAQADFGMDDLRHVNFTVVVT